MTTKKKARPVPVHLDARVVPIALLHPNPWNVNQMTPGEYDAARESVRESGFVDPVTVRQHPKRRGHWEIIDGEQRWKAAKDEGAATISVNVLELSDEALARRLTLQMNNKGTPDRLALAKQLAALHQRLGDAVGLGLPWRGEELKELVALAAAAFPEYAGDGPGSGRDFVTLTFHVPRDAQPVIEDAIAKASKAGESEDRGVALERVCADYLAGA